MFSEQRLFQVGQKTEEALSNRTEKQKQKKPKKTMKYWYKIFLLQHVKMFIKRKTRGGKTCAYQMLAILRCR